MNHFPQYLIFELRKALATKDEKMIRYWYERIRDSKVIDSMHDQLNQLVSEYKAARLYIIEKESTSDTIRS